MPYARDRIQYKKRPVYTQLMNFIWCVVEMRSRDPRGAGDGAAGRSAG